MHQNEQVILSLLFYQACHERRIYSLPKLQKSRRVTVSRPGFCAYQTPYELCLLTYIITPLCTPINNFKERTALIPTHPSHLMLTYDCTESQGCFNVLPLSQIFDDNFAKREINQFTVRCRTVKNGKECPWKGKLRKIEVSIRSCQYTKLHTLDSSRLFILRTIRSKGSS